jgi:hypothetical protein
VTVWPGAKPDWPGLVVVVAVVVVAGLDPEALPELPGELVPVCPGFADITV